MSSSSWYISPLQNARDLAFVSSSSLRRTLSGCAFRFKAESRLIHISFQSLIRMKRRERLQWLASSGVATAMEKASRDPLNRCALHFRWLQKLDPGIAVKHLSPESSGWAAGHSSPSRFAALFVGL